MRDALNFCYPSQSFLILRHARSVFAKDGLSGVFLYYFDLNEILWAILGQKGIGFKSVFRVSDCPEVHSNGYHIRFDAKSGPVGYILPQWVEENCADNDTSEHEDDELEDTGEGDSDHKVPDSVGEEFGR